MSLQTRGRWARGSHVCLEATGLYPLLRGERLVLPTEMRAKPGRAMAGLDPRTHQSGSSVYKKPRWPKAGSRYLRIARYLPALSTARLDPNVRAFYHHLITTRGLKRIQAVGAVMRMLLLAIHAMLRTRMPFDSRRFYSPTDTIA